jgi:hypothetical protein
LRGSCPRLFRDLLEKTLTRWKTHKPHAEVSLHPFGVTLRNLLQERPEFVTPNRNINWAAVAEALPDVSYETLRKAVAGERQPTLSLMERAAALANIQPNHFVEYRLAEAQRQFNSSEVGWDAAMESLARLANARLFGQDER